MEYHEKKILFICNMQGCDQYFFGNGGSGTIQAFNYDQPTPAYQAKLAGHLVYFNELFKRSSIYCNL